MAKAALKPTRRVYTPHKAGLPPLGDYFGEVRRRYDFARELSATNMRAANTNTVLGQAWLVINPLLLALVYYLLIFVIGGSHNADFAQITSGLFLFFFMSGVVTACATSVTNAGSLILNMNFPKYLLIISNLQLALRRFIPTLVVYAIIHVVRGKPITVHLLWVPVVIALMGLFAAGLGSIMATWHVYFRDTAQFLPYFIRIWLYLSPVLYSAEQFLERMGDHWVGDVAQVANPLFGIFAVWADALNGVAVQGRFIGLAVGWTLVVFLLGSIYFISRERDFAVRL